jgi:Zn-dependent M28 family amino/carboxypeptidase
MKDKLILIVILLLLIGCENDKKRERRVVVKTPATSSQPQVEKPVFDADSAYLFVKQQVDFGPRFPNNKAHGKCALFLEKKLKEYGLQTITQIGTALTFNNKKITIKNIIGAYNPEAKNRILLFAHWDSRPFADQDTKNMTHPILGANDGASGVGILIEVARQLSLTKPETGVDIIFFDAEDYGQPSGMNSTASNTYCLGSQYWSKNLHQENYSAKFGILLDMVGNSNPYFTQESISMQYAPTIVQKVWRNAHSLGYSQNFSNQRTAFVGTDDHQFVNAIAGIPSIDIIHYEKASGNFHSSWHTHNDNMEVIDKKSLSMVGEVLLYTIYQEK